MDVEIVLVPFELRPSMPEEGYQVSELEHAGHSDRVEKHIERIAERDGFPWVDPPFVPKTHRALSLGEIARDAGEEKHWTVHTAIFTAYFGEARDIGRPEVLLDIAEQHEIDPNVLERVWDEDAYGERLHQFRHVGIGLGIESTPAALICNELIIGSRPLRVFQEALERCLVTPENVEEVAAEQ
jgi:predicted DsbA family dithiol-disulfide isomerase